MAISIARRTRSSRLTQMSKRPCAVSLSWVAVVLAISILCGHAVPGDRGMASADPSADLDQSIPPTSLGLVARSCANYCRGPMMSGVDLWLSLEEVSGVFQWVYSEAVALCRRPVSFTTAFTTVVVGTRMLLWLFQIRYRSCSPSFNTVSAPTGWTLLLFRRAQSNPIWQTTSDDTASTVE